MRTTFNISHCLCHTDLQVTKNFYAMLRRYTKPEYVTSVYLTSTRVFRSVQLRSFNIDEVEEIVNTKNIKSREVYLDIISKIKSDIINHNGKVPNTTDVWESRKDKSSILDRRKQNRIDFVKRFNKQFGGGSNAED